MAAAVFGSAATNVSAGVGGSLPLAPDRARQVKFATSATNLRDPTAP